MKTTFKTPTGCSITVEPSPTKGFVWIRWSNPAPGSAPSCIIPVPVHMAGNIAQAIEATGTAIEEGARPELPAHTLSPAVEAVRMTFPHGTGLNPEAEEDARRFAAGIAVCGELQP